MALNSPIEDSYCIATEVAPGQITAGGALAYLSLESHSIEAESFEITPIEANLDRGEYSKGSAGELRPVQIITGASISAVVPLRGPGVAYGTRPPELEPFLLAAGLQVSTGVYTPASPITSHSTLNAARTYGTLLQRLYAGAVNLQLAAASGEVVKATFSGTGNWLEPQEEAHSGSTYTVDSTDPVIFDRSTVSFTAAEDVAGNSLATRFPSFTAPHVASFSLDLQNTISPVTSGTLQALPNYAVLQDDGGSFTSYLTESNESTADDVEPWAATPAINDAFYIGSPMPAWGHRIQHTDAGSSVMTVVPEYYNGASWATLPMGRQQWVDGDETAGLLENLWHPPADWARTTVNGVVAFWVRYRVSAYTSISNPTAIGQIWTLYPSAATKHIVTQQKPRLTLVVEMEDDATFDPVREWRGGVTRSLGMTLGTGQYNTWSLGFTDAKYMEIPKTVIDGGIVRHTLVFGAPSAWNITAVQ